LPLNFGSDAGFRHGLVLSHSLIHSLIHSILLGRLARKIRAYRRYRTARSRATEPDLSGSGAPDGRGLVRAVLRPLAGEPSHEQATGGTIRFVGVSIEKAQYLDLERLAASAYSAD
jgi:hypothetical protein